MNIDKVGHEIINARSVAVIVLQCTNAEYKLSLVLLNYYVRWQRGTARMRLLFAGGEVIDISCPRRRCKYGSTVVYYGTDGADGHAIVL